MDLLAQSRLQEIRHVDDHFVGVERLRRQRLLARKGKQALRQRCGALSGSEAAVRNRSMAKSPFLTRRVTRSSAPMITPSILLKSWAMPPVS